MMTVLAERFRNGRWEDSEHLCTSDEVEAVTNSAEAKALEHGFPSLPLPVDYLLGARFIFDVAFGSDAAPAENDTRVYGVIVNGMVSADFEKLKRHFLHTAA